MEWLINRRRMMYNKAVPPAYLTFEDPEIWRICCENWGDYNETVITAGDSENTVNIVESFVSKRNTLEKSRVVLNTQTNVDNSGGIYTIGTTKEAVGITKKQCAAVTSLQKKFANNMSIGKFHEFKYFTSVTQFSSGGDLSHSSLTEITFPSSITQIYGGYAFNDCKQLYKLNMNEGLTQLGSYMIFGNESLKKLVVPSTVTSLYGNSLTVYTNTSIQCTIIMLPENPPTLLSGLLYSGVSIEAVYVPDNSLTAYKEAQYWSAIADKIYPISEYVES